jgi:hypothetical protein
MVMKTDRRFVRPLDDVAGRNEILPVFVIHHRREEKYLERMNTIVGRKVTHWAALQSGPSGQNPAIYAPQITLLTCLLGHSGPNTQNPLL